MYDRILHATDLNETHFNLCQQAVNIAKHFNARLYLLHVIEPPASLQLAQGLGFAQLNTPIQDDAKTVLKTLGDAFNIPEDQQFVETGSIKTHVFEKALALGCSLIIIGSHTASNIPAFLGSTARDIVRDATSCDVLTVQTHKLSTSSKV
jgi:universal stress protein A